MSFELNDISADSLRLLQCIRLHPDLNSKLATIFTYLNASLNFFFLILAIKGILWSYSVDMFFMSECFQTCILMTHAIVKFLTVHNSKKYLLGLLKKKAKFWKISDVDVETCEECLKIFNIVKFVTRSYILLVLITGIAFDLQPFTSGNLPTICYVPEGWYNYLTVMIWYLSLVDGTCISATDLLLFSLVSAAIVQFKLLAYRYRNIIQLNQTSGKELWKELKILIDYHNLLLSYCEDLNVTFRNIFLLQFLMAIASCAVSVFIFMQPGSWTNRFKFMLYFLIIMVETGFYCIPLEIAMNNAQEINIAMYDSKWYEVNDTHFKKCLSVVICKAQEPIVFSGYGMINMNLRTYVTITKTVFSYYTYLRSMERLSQK